MTSLLRSLGITIILVSIFVVNTKAQTPPPTPNDDQVNAVARELYCPVCENIPLDVCGTQACEQWRGLIREKLMQGWSKEQIKQYFVDQYGDRVLATPPAKGFNWLIYIIPPLVILLWTYFLYRAFVTWKKIEKPAENDARSYPNQDEYVSRLEEELKNR